MAKRLLLILASVCLIGCNQRRSAALAPISEEYRPFDSQDFVEQGMAPAVSVAKAEFEKRRGKPTEARYLFGTSGTNYYVVLIQPVLGYDHGRALTDTNQRCEVWMSEQLKVMHFYSAQ